jgi:hypothetical protein
LQLFFANDAGSGVGDPQEMLEASDERLLVVQRLIDIDSAAR